MADDIEEFLRQAMQRRAARRQQGAGGGAAGGNRPTQPPVTRAPRPPVEIVEPEIVEAQPVRPAPVAMPSSPPRLPAQGFHDQEFAQHAAHLGEDVALADDQVEARLRQKFGERAREGSNISGPGEQHEADAAQAMQLLRAMLRNPTSLRQAIILNEILNPPYREW